MAACQEEPLLSKYCTFKIDFKTALKSKLRMPMYVGNRREDDLQVHDHLWNTVIPLRQALHRDVGVFILNLSLFFIFIYFIFTPEVLYIVFVSEMYLLSRGIRHLLKKVLSVFLDQYSGAHSTLCPTWASQQMFLVQRVTLGCTTLQKCPSSSSCFFQGA